MSNYIILSFILYAIIDYIQLASFFDSKIFLTKSGSKLNNILNPSAKHLVKLTFNQIVIVFISSLALFILNFAITIATFNSNFLEIRFFSITINISAVLLEKFKYFKIAYYILSFIFFFSILLKYKDKLEAIVLKLINSNKYTIESVPSANDKELFLGAYNCEQPISISLNSLFQNLLITGSIGSGKTSGAICNITYQLIKEGLGGLILDAKGNFANTIKKMCKKCGRENDLKIISLDSSYSIQLLEAGITPQELANRIRHVIELITPNNNSDSYWLDKIENVLLNLIIIMDYCGGRDFLLLHEMVTSQQKLVEVIEKCTSKVTREPPDDKKSFELFNAMLFLKEEYLKLDSKIFSVINSEITRLTIPLITEYEVYKQFVLADVKKEKIDFFKSDNQIVVLSINIGKRRSLCKIIATFLKLSYQKFILSTLEYPKTFPHFFICDEFQEFVNKDDSSFLSLSREAKCINIISTQSYMSLKNELKSDEAVSVILQNFVNKVWFRNDDNYTNSEVVKQLGKVVVKRENTSFTENAKESKRSMLYGGFKNIKSNISSGISYTSVKENEFDENFFSRELKTFEALSFIKKNNNEEIQLNKIKFKIWEENYV